MVESTLTSSSSSSSYSTPSCSGLWSPYSSPATATELAAAMSSGTVKGSTGKSPTTALSDLIPSSSSTTCRGDDRSEGTTSREGRVDAKGDPLTVVGVVEEEGTGGWG